MSNELSSLTVTVVELKQGEYRAVSDPVRWQLDKVTPEGKVIDVVAQAERPTRYQFQVMPGHYRLVVVWQQQEKAIELDIKPGKILDKLIIFSDQPQTDDYHLADVEAFNPDNEHVRRQQERAGQRRYGASASPLRSPDLAAAAQQMGQLMDSSLMAHPILSQSTQFDGISPKLNQDASQNQHAAEAQMEPELRPGAQPSAQPTAQPSSAPKPSPF